MGCGCTEVWPSQETRFPVAGISRVVQAQIILSLTLADDNEADASSQGDGSWVYPVLLPFLPMVEPKWPKFGVPSFAGTTGSALPAHAIAPPTLMHPVATPLPLM